jgi:hypothetical protein
MKALTYDQRTLNKVYAELRNKKEDLKRQASGFRKESLRYLKLGDNENFQLSSEVSLGLGMAVNEVDEIIYTLKKSFKKKTNATKRIKK